MTAATSTSTLGFVLWTVTLTIVGWASAVAANWWALKSRGTNKPLSAALRGSLWPGTFLLSGMAGLVAIVWLFFIAGTIYSDHELLVKGLNDLRSTNKHLNEELEDNKHFLDVLQAFTIYRVRISGVLPTKCTIKTTAPNEEHSISVMISQLANAASQCTTFGPMDANLNPEVRQETENGMVDGVVIFHARRDDKAAFELFGVLSNTLRLRLSYEVPIGSPGHFVWLQYGKSVKWNQ